MSTIAKLHLLNLNVPCSFLGPCQLCDVATHNHLDSTIGLEADASDESMGACMPYL